MQEKRGDEEQTGSNEVRRNYKGKRVPAETPPLLCNKHSLSTFYMPSSMLSTKYRGKQGVASAQTVFTVLYLVVYTLLSTRVTWLLGETRDSHSHLPGLLDSPAKDEARDSSCFTGVPDDVMINQAQHPQLPLPRWSLTGNHCLYFICKIVAFSNAVYVSQIQRRLQGLPALIQHSSLAIVCSSGSFLFISYLLLTHSPPCGWATVYHSPTAGHLHCLSF